MSPAEIRKEKIKLQANLLNGLAIGIVLIGAFTPITHSVYDPSIAASALGLMAVLAIICVATGGALHYHALRRLDALEEHDQ
ncbi:MAG: hypothetical protein BGN94_01260 [Rhizobiales bacterium 68-8]|nr:MAG: hypothetical protein BGN94_01260 [Rhizobiales bacterium 68-8]